MGLEKRQVRILDVAVGIDDQHVLGGLLNRHGQPLFRRLHATPLAEFALQFQRAPGHELAERQVPEQDCHDRKRNHADRDRHPLPQALEFLWIDAADVDPAALDRFVLLF